ncbi:MAG: class II fructose-bisphosphate aldolase, partial [Xenococcus sp. (in: cyanobacteria)]
VSVTAEVVKVAHSIGASVEGELGCLGSLETGKGDKEDGHGFEGTLSKDQLLTDPDEAVEFVEKTQVDALAVAIGTSHGAYKFTRKPTGEILAISRIEEIHSRLPNTHLVMHGSSSVPQEWLDMINEYGGKIPETYGVPVEEIQKGIKSGVRKVNIDTDNRLAITAAIREAAAKDPSNFDPRHFMKPSMKYMKQVCADRYTQFWTAGNASKIKQMTLDDYAAKYASGELAASTKKAVSVGG